MLSVANQGTMMGRGLRGGPIRSAARAQGRALAGSLVRGGGALSRAIFTFDRSVELGCPGASGQSAAGGGRGRHGECCPQEPAGFRFPPLCPVQAVRLCEAYAGLSPQAVSLGLDVAEPPHSLTLQGHLSSAALFSWSRLRCHSCCVRCLTVKQ